jgi:hypothetical protein
MPTRSAELIYVAGTHGAVTQTPSQRRPSWAEMEDRVSMPLSRFVIWLGLAVLAGAWAHEGLTRAREPRPAQVRDAQSDADGELLTLLMARKYVAQFEREFPAAARAQYVGPLRFRWHSLAQYFREDARFSHFEFQLAALAYAGCPQGTASGTRFEVTLHHCHATVTRDALTRLILRGATVGDLQERYRLTGEFSKLPNADQELALDEFLTRMGPSRLVGSANPN